MSNDKFSLDNKEPLRLSLTDVRDFEVFAPAHVASQIEKALAPIVNDFYTGGKSIADIAKTIQTNISAYSDPAPFAPINFNLNVSEKVKEK